MKSLEPGASLGPYKILDVLGNGGLGTVYRARQVSLERDVALKVLSTALAVDPDLVERFRREARTAASLRHPRIVTVYDTGQDRGYHYIAMELLAGRTLDRLPLPLEWPQALDVVRQLCEALAYAHERGVVHRDLKPENILIDESGAVTLTDFSIARVVGQASLTLGGGPIGTPEFMSPEQAHGENVDARSDVYSLGILLYFLLTGESPFKAENALATIYRQIHEPLPPLPPVVPTGMTAWMTQCAEKAALDRFADCSEALEALNAAVSTSDGAPPATVLTPETPPTPGSATGDTDSVPNRGSEMQAPVIGYSPVSAIASAAPVNQAPVSAGSPTFVRYPAPSGSPALAHSSPPSPEAWTYPAWSGLLVASSALTPLLFQNGGFPLPYVFWLLTLGMSLRCWRQKSTLRRVPFVLSVVGMLFAIMTLSTRWDAQQGWLILLVINAVAGGLAGVYTTGATVRARRLRYRRGYAVLESQLPGETTLPAAVQDRLLDEMSRVARRLGFRRRQIGLRITPTLDGPRLALDVQVFDRDAGLAIADTWVQGPVSDAAELAGDAARKIYLKLSKAALPPSRTGRYRPIRALPGPPTAVDTAATTQRAGRRRGD